MPLVTPGMFPLNSVSLKRYVALIALFWVIPWVASAAPRIVVTMPWMAQWVETLADRQVEVDILIPEGSDPHAFALRPSQARLLARADLVVFVGDGSEAGIESWLRQAPHLALFAESEPEEGHHNKEEGHLHLHSWMDPDEMRLAAQRMTVRLGEILPGSDFAPALKWWLANLDAFEDTLHLQASHHPDLYVVSSHGAALPLLEHIGIANGGWLAPPGGAPSPRTLTRLVAAMKRHGDPVVLAEPPHNAALARRVANEAGARVVIWETLGRRDGGWLGMMGGNLDRLFGTVHE